MQPVELGGVVVSIRVFVSIVVFEVSLPAQCSQAVYLVEHIDSPKIRLVAKTPTVRNLNSIHWVFANRDNVVSRQCNRTCVANLCPCHVHFVTGLMAVSAERLRF